MKLKIKIGGHRGNWNLFVFKQAEGWKQLNLPPFSTKREAIDARKDMYGLVCAIGMVSNKR